MKPHVVLLLTRDSGLRDLVGKALSDAGGVLVSVEDVGDAFRTIDSCVSALDFVIIDFDDGCHGMTLLSAVHTCLPDVPIAVVLSDDVYHSSALAYANGAASCITKPVNLEELEILMEALAAPKPNLEEVLATSDFCLA